MEVGTQDTNVAKEMVCDSMKRGDLDWSKGEIAIERQNKNWFDIEIVFQFYPQTDSFVGPQSALN